MYYYDKEKNTDFFDGDLTIFLLEHGVSIEHIDKMKSKLLEDHKEYYYDPVPNRSCYEDLVPLDKVIGTNRGTIGSSVYENVNSIPNGKRRPDKFQRCFDFLGQMSLDELKKTYEELIVPGDPVQMSHYIEDDVYFVDNGNHRTLTAMLLGAKYIRAIITDYYCDVKKKEKYIYSQRFLKKYHIERMEENKNCVAIFFNDGNGTYGIYDYPGPEDEEGFYAYVERLSGIIDEEVKRARFINQMPPFIKKVILRFAKNCRINQYIDRRYLSEEEIERLGDRQSFSLYKVI